MSGRKFISEFCLNMQGTCAVVLQQDGLEALKTQVQLPPFHIYMIARRPRITIEPQSLVFTEDKVSGRFLKHVKNERQPIDFEVRNLIGTAEVDVNCDYPFTEITILSRSGERLARAKTALLLGTLSREFYQHLDLEVLYVGQAFGGDGSRTALERLATHSTLQGIYAEAQRRTPDQETWIVLWSFEPWVVASFDGRPQTYQTTRDEDNVHVENVLSSSITEQQRINFTEAALIKYFQPEYNTIFRERFPNPAHSTYAECYDLDLNSVAVELDTESIMCRLWSSAVSPKWLHLPTFDLHSVEERKSMFDFSPIS